MANNCGYETSAGVTLMRQDSAVDPAVWELVGGVIEMPQFSFTASTATCDDFDSAIEGFEEYFKSGRFSMPELSLNLGMIAGNPVQEKIYQDSLRVGNDVDGQTEKVGWRITIPTDTVYTIEFGALVVGYGWTFPKPSTDDNKIVTPVQLRPSGPFTRVV